MALNKWVVITTINKPNDRVLKFINLGYKVLIIGDRKTPLDWHSFDHRIEYLDYESQEREYPVLSKLIGPNTYARKNIGYLHAIKMGADVIWETDDDTFPLDDSTDPLIALGKKRYATNMDAVWNPYSHFLPNTRIWPRGFPLEQILNSFEMTNLEEVAIFADVDILQTLVNNEPDVDAIYRLTVDSRPTTFPLVEGAVEVSKGIAPGNTQSTFWLTEKSFESIYFPVTVNNRFADILKMYVAQVNNDLLYAGFLVEQFRNPHNYMIDFKDEFEMYENLESLCKFILSQDQGSSLEKLYSELANLGICELRELDVLKSFLLELNAILNS